jgi:hypothetical protein
MSFMEFQLRALYCNTQNFETAFKKSLEARGEYFAAIKASHLVNHHGGN